MPLLRCFSRTGAHIQGNIFPWLTEELGPLTEAHKRVVMTLELAGVEAFVQVWPGLPGRPPRDRAALVRAFVAKAVLGLPTTSMLIERLAVDKPLRRLCGWEHPGELPSEATFSRAFAEFGGSALPGRLHEALIKRTHEDRLVGHISLALRWLRYRCLHRLFAGLDRGRIARDVADQTVLMGPLDQRLVQASRQRAPPKLREGAREGCLAGKLSGVFPAAQPAQWLVHREPLDQHRGRREPEHRLGHKGAHQRRPGARRATPAIRARHARTPRRQQAQASSPPACAPR